MVKSKACYACEETEQESDVHDGAYRIYKLLYYVMIILVGVLFLIMVDVSVLKDYTVRQTMLYLALTGIVLMVSERILDFKLKRWGVID